MNQVGIAAEGKFTELIYQNEHVSSWLFETTDGQKLQIQAKSRFEIIADKNCKINAHMAFREREGLEGKTTFSMRLYLVHIAYKEKSFMPGEKIPPEMIEKIEKWYWAYKDRSDLTLEEVNALRFTELQMQEGWKDYRLEESE